MRVIRYITQCLLYFTRFYVHFAIFLIVNVRHKSATEYRIIDVQIIFAVLEFPDTLNLFRVKCCGYVKMYVRKVIVRERLLIFMDSPMLPTTAI